MKYKLSDYKHVIIVSLAYFAVLFSSSFTKGYEYFIDEFYYIACANNPAAGYVDHPPLAPLILTVLTFIFGDSVYSIRFLASLASAGTVFMAGLLAEKFGGGKISQLIASLCVIASPVFPVFGGFYSMNVFEPLLCSFVFWYLAKMILEKEKKYWINIGILFGLLMMNKHTAALCIIFIVLSLLFTEHRKLLASKYFLYGALIAFVIFLPNLIWQVLNGYPSLEFYVANITGKNIHVPYTEFLLMQLLTYNPFLVPLFILAAGFLIFKNRKFRIFGMIFLFTIIFFLITRNSRFDRTAFSYLCVIPAGAVLIENFIKTHKSRWMFTAAGFLVFVYAFIAVPMFLPYLNYGNTAKLTSFVGLNTEIEKGNRPLIAQTIADRIGWEEKVDMVGKVYLSLSEEERKNTLIAATNYGAAGALELYGKKYGFVNVVSGHNNYYLWSKKRLNGNILLQLSDTGSYNGLKESFEYVEKSGEIFDNIYCTPHERNLTVFICKNPKYNNQELLERGKRFY